MKSILAALVLGVTLMAPPAQATAPGGNAALDGGPGTIYFRNYPDIWAMDGDGANQRATGLPFDGRGFTWSPDGSRIAYYALDSDYDIWVMGADGSSPMQVTTHRGDDVGPTWSPDGTRLAFSSFRRGHWRIYTIAVAGPREPAVRITGPASLAGTTADDVGGPDWSPTGDLIAFTRRRWSDLKDRDVITVRTVTATGGDDTLIAERFGSPVWSPSGDEIAAIGISKPFVGVDTRIFVLAADGSSRSDLGLSQAYARSQLTWSPDGDEIAFVEYPDDSGSSSKEIRKVATDGSQAIDILYRDSVELFDWVT
jgi:Tol biopolymer transport system component